jgi:serine/threonine protein kinase
MTPDWNLLAGSAGLRATLGDYHVVAEIGRGGMGSVFLALVPQADGSRRPLVLKQLQPELAQDQDFRAMFENEALLASRLHHPNVVETSQIYADRDLCALVMEFLDGQTLARIRQRDGQGASVPFSIHLRVLAETLAGLHYVHEFTDERGNPLGIVHRDVSPSNIFVTYDGGVKVVDFGIAKATMHHVETRIDVLKGKLAYMSPEAVRNERLDRRSDIFSVGVMLWEAATGRRFWYGHDEVSIFQHLLAGNLPLKPPGELGRMSGEMHRIAVRALSVDRARRYATAEEMRVELLPLIAGLGRVAEPAALEGYMEAFFSDDREKLRAMIDNALAASPPAQRWLDVTSPSREADPSEAPTRISTLPVGEGTLRSVISAYDVFGDSGKPRHFRRGLQRTFAVACGAVIAALGVAYASHRAGDSPGLARQSTSVLAPTTVDETPVVVKEPRVDTPPTPETRPVSEVRPPAETRPISEVRPPAETRPAPPEVPTSAATSTARSEEILAVFVARPANASLFLDGVSLSGNPASLRRKPDDKRHALRVEAPGYAPTVRMIELSRDVAKEIELAPETPRGNVGTAKAVPGRDDPWGI